MALFCAVRGRIILSILLDISIGLEDGLAAPHGLSSPLHRGHVEKYEKSTVPYGVCGRTVP